MTEIHEAAHSVELIHVPFIYKSTCTVFSTGIITLIL